MRFEKIGSIGANSCEAREEETINQNESRDQENFSWAYYSTYIEDGVDPCLVGFFFSADIILDN